MIDFIHEWIENVNRRYDLLPAWRERKLNVVLEIGQHLIYLFIDHTGVHFKSKQEGQGNLLLRSSSTVMEELFKGSKKLTSLPETMINVQGAYRNILFMESLLLLSR
ncbi:hypothetical protein [Halobacillus sp. BBL2006]|uniref:hypothetical protein n=1 Tax=Halobacillus sp. BBL2006 TaxID=1543706 RepID=UPI000542D5DA|nr:hypothetical protein [Halobacillus sp. BBL2006]KHE68673.1 hypothetical protein LD39_14155 [Halobacillus sp. BBL2006]